MIEYFYPFDYDVKKAQLNLPSMHSSAFSFILRIELYQKPQKDITQTSTSPNDIITQPPHTSPLLPHRTCTRRRRNRPTHLRMQRYILPHRHILTIRIPQHLTNHTTPSSLNPPHLARRIIRQSPSNLLCFTQGCISWVENAQPDAFLLAEVSFDVDNADWEEVGFVGEGGVGASVDVDCSMGRKAMEEPEVAVADGGGGGEEAGV